MRILPSCLFIAILLNASLLSLPGALAADPQIRSITMEETDWTVQVTGTDSPEFFADATPLGAEALGRLNGASVYRIAPPPAGTNQLLVAEEGEAVVGVRIGSTTPETAPFNDWIVYHIMMGYFRNANPGNDRRGMRRWIHTNYAGGDLQGVLQKADYLASLGVNAVWLSPVFDTETSHGYDVRNYYRIGDGVGVPGKPDASLELFRELTRSLQSRGVRVILDLPLDYGSGAYDMKNGDPHRLRPRHTRARQEAEKVWESWGSDFRYWNFSNERTRQFLKEVALYWLRDENVDGLRLDYVRGVPHDFWAGLFTAVKTEKPGAFLFGEAWQDGHSERANAVDIADYYEPVAGRGPQFDSLIDFPMQMAMTAAFARGGSALKLEKWLQQTAALYGPAARPLYFLDNHDLARFLSWTQDNREARLLAALTFMSALSSPMAVFYGTETGIRAGRPQRGFVDSGRLAMPWGDLDERLIASVSAILGGRRSHPALTHGGRIPLMSSEDKLVMMKVHPDETLLVAVNLANVEQTVSFDPGAHVHADATFEPLLNAPGPDIADDGTVRWVLPPISTSMARVIAEK